jgi:peptide methionine sulfoxide reductase msrA/msrB
MKILKTFILTTLFSLNLYGAKMENIKNAYFAGGCFWGVEYYFEKVNGVLKADSGYMGGQLNNPSYREVCNGNTGHLEVVEVRYDSKVVSFESLARLFLEIHDPTQTNGQGPDIGSQYLSAIFYSNENEKQISQKLLDILTNKGYKIATKLISTKNTPFFRAEEYHQDYYFKHNKIPYCHSYVKRF